MGVDNLMRSLGELFQPAECKNLVSALNQEPLVWKSLNNQECLSAFISYAHSSFDSWTPGNLATMIIDADNLCGINWQDPRQVLPDFIRTRTEQAYETIHSTRLSPETLEQAGLNALYIREYYLAHKSWQGISQKLVFRSSVKIDNFNFALWRGTFACLPALIPEFAEFSFSLLSEIDADFKQDFIALIVHAVLSSPTSSQTPLARIGEIFNQTDLDSQGSSLFFLEQFGYPDLAKNLASEFLTQKKNLTEFSEALSHVERDSKSPGHFNNYQKVQVMERLADLYQYAGLNQKSIEIMKVATNALGESQTRFFHRLAVSTQAEDPHLAQDYWEKAISSSPLTDQMQIEYAEFLISQKNTQAAQDFLSTHSDPTHANFISLHHPQLKIEDTMKISKSSVLSDYFSLQEQSLSTPPTRLKEQLKSSIPLINQEKDYETALGLINKQLLKSPNDEEFLSHAIYFHEQLGQIQPAIDRASLLAILNPDNLQNKIVLADLYAKTRQFDKAFAIHQSLIINSPAPTRDELLNYANIAVEAGKPDLAIPICKNFLEKDKLDGEALVILGNAYIERGDKTIAIEYMEKAASISPEKPSSWLALANIWNRMGEYEHALDTLQKGKTALPDDPQILLALGSSFLRNKLPADALPVLKQCRKAEPKNKKVKIALAQAYHLLGQTEEAWQSIKDIRDQSLADPELALITGQIMSEMGQHTQAIPNLKFAFQTNRSSEALISLSKELLEVANNPVNNQDDTLQVAEDLKSTLSDLKNAVNHDETSFTYQLLIADVNTTLGEHEQAYHDYLNLLEQPEAKSPQTYQHIQFGIGKNAFRLKYPEISLAALQEALINNPDDIEAHHYLAEAFVQSGLIDEAYKSAKTALDIQPSDMDNLLWFSEFMLRNGQPQSAIQTLKEAIQLAPKQRELYLTLAKTYISLNDHQSAKSSLNDLIALEEITTDEMVNAANIFYRLDEVLKASEILKAAISKKEKPEFGTLRDLAASLQHIDEPKEALRLVDEQGGNFQGNSSYAILRSDILAQLANYQDALIALEPVLKKIEYMPDLLNRSTSKRESVAEDTMEYSPAGVHWRAAQLKRITGDLLPAKKHVDQSVTIAPRQIEHEYLAAELVFALNQKSNLNEIFNNLLSTKQELSRKQQNLFITIVSMVCQLNLMDGDYEAASTIFKKHLADLEPTVISYSLQARLASHYQEKAIAENYFTLAEKKAVENNSSIKHRFLTISEKFESAWQQMSLALAAWGLNKWDKAYDLFQAAVAHVQINPIMNFFHAKFLLAYANEYFACKAMRVEKHAPKLDPSEPVFQQHFNEQLSLAGRFLDLTIIEHLHKKSQAIFNNSLFEHDNLFKLIKNSDDAVQLLPLIKDPGMVKTVLDAYPENDDISLQYAVMLLDDNPQRSNRIAVKLLEKDPNSPLLHALVAFSSPGDPEKAIKSMELALSLWQDEPEWHAFVADLYYRKAQFDPASKHLEQSISIDPEQAHYWQALGEVKLEEKDLNSAKTYFAKACDIFPDNPQVLQALSGINRRMGDFEAALRCLQIAEQKEPENPQYSETIAELYHDQGDLDKAIDKANLLLMKYPESINAKLTIIKSLIKKRRFDLAKAALKSALAKEPGLVEFKLAELELIREDQGAASALTAAIDLAAKNQENIGVINTLAALLVETGRQDQAEKALYHSLEVEPDQAQVYLMLGRISRKNGNLDQAIAQLSKAIAFDPSLVDAYLELGKTHQDRREHSKAIQIYKQAIQIVSTDSRLYFHAGIAYKESRDYRNAEAMLRQAASLAPDDTSIRRQLAAVVTLNLVHNLQEAPRK